MGSCLRLSVILMLGAFAPGLAVAGDGPLRVLVLSGSNNHDWRTTTPALVGILEGAGFVVRVEETVAQMRPDSLDGVAVVVSNFNVFGQDNPGAIWGPEVRAAFLNFIRQGGGFVGVHAGGSVFYDWPEFQVLCGGWWGPQTSHGRKHEAEVNLLPVDHPITRGLAAFRTVDEYWQGTSLSPGALSLAMVTPDAAHGGSARPEPVLVVTQLGAGRGAGLLLGHDALAMQTPGFQSLLMRSVHWAATGRAYPATTPQTSTTP